jgi:hypothetical protein
MYACVVLLKILFYSANYHESDLLLQGMSPQESSSRQRPHKCNTKGETCSNQGGCLALKLITHHLKEVILEANDDAITGG